MNADVHQVERLLRQSTSDPCVARQHYRVPIVLSSQKGVSQSIGMRSTLLAERVMLALQEENVDLGGQFADGAPLILERESDLRSPQCD